MRLRTLLMTSLLTVQATALASLDTAARQLASALGGVVQTCPQDYAQAVCLRVDGTVTQIAERLDASLPALIPGLWRDGPAQGLTADVPSEKAVLHLIPRSETQVLAIFQPTGSAAPKVTPLQDVQGVVLENPGNHYVLILDEANQPVRDLTTVRDGRYTIITSGYGRQTQTQRVTVGPEGLRTLKVPQLAAAPANPAAGGLVLPSAPGYLFVVYAANRTLVTDLSVLRPGYYDVFSYRAGETGPLAGSQLVQLGQLTRPQFNGSFAGSNVVTPTPSSPSLYAPSTPRSGQCWVSGYRRSNGTYVSGYYRRC